MKLNMKRLNNKGYMLVEIILASALAFGVAYFLIDLTMKLKNKNDDLLVETLASTDQAIITNIIMKDLYSTTNEIDCDYVKNKIIISGKSFKYGDETNGYKTNIVNDYTTIGSVTCTNSTNNITIKIPLTTEILGNKYDVDIKYKKK